MAKINALIILLASAIAGSLETIEEQSNSFDRLLKEFVDDDGMVDYHGISRGIEDLNLYLNFIKTNLNFLGKEN